jgi:hypothetical protein
MGTIMMVLTWMGFTLPPECACYWVGEVGFPPSEDAEKRRKNPAVPHMAMNMARNLVYYAQLLREHPMMVGASKGADVTAHGMAMPGVEILGAPATGMDAGATV